MSEKELAMLETIDAKLCSYIHYHINHVGPVAVLRIFVEHAFTFNLTGPAVESLRRVYKAVTVDGMCRNTPEYEALIQL